jgi:hypothetical protein
MLTLEVEWQRVALAKTWSRRLLELLTASWSGSRHVHQEG